MTFMHMTARKFAASLFIFAIAVSIDHEASADDHGGKPQPYEYAVASDMASEALLLDVASAGSRLVAVGEFGHVLLSDDKGTSWRQAASVPTRNTLVGVTFLDNQTGYAVGHAATILKTEDGGDNWTLQYNERNGETPLLCCIFCRCPKWYCSGWFFLHI